MPTNTTVEQFIELLRGKPFSRVPVFEGTIHNVVGIVHAQDVLQVPDSEAQTRTVDSLMRTRCAFRAGEQTRQRPVARNAENTISAWPLWWTNTEASLGW